MTRITKLLLGVAFLTIIVMCASVFAAAPTKGVTTVKNPIAAVIGIGGLDLIGGAEVCIARPQNDFRLVRLNAKSTAAPVKGIATARALVIVRLAPAVGTKAQAAGQAAEALAPAAGAMLMMK